MEEKIISLKPASWWMLLVPLALIAVLLVWVVGDLNYKNSVNLGTISFSAEGKISTAPDTAAFNFSVITQGSDLSKVKSDNNDIAKKAIDYLKSKEFEDKNIKTTNYYLSPQYQYYSCYGAEALRPCPPATISGYQLTQTISAKTKDFDKASDALGALPEYGVNEISALRFTIDDEEPYKAQARAEAVKQLREKVKAFEQSSGVRVGKLINFSENFGGPILYKSVMAEGLGGAGDSIPVPIQAGENEISVSIVATYRLK